MFIKILIMTLILLGAIITVPFLLSIVFNKDANIKIHSCAPDYENTQGDVVCSSCQIKELTSCKYKEQQLQKTKTKKIKRGDL